MMITRRVFLRDSTAAIATTSSGLTLCRTLAQTLPSEGVPLFSQDVLARFKLAGPQADKAEIVLADAQLLPEGMPRGSILRARTLDSTRDGESVFIFTPTTAAVEKGDILLAIFWVRCVES